MSDLELLLTKLSGELRHGELVVDDVAEREEVDVHVEDADEERF